MRDNSRRFTMLIVSTLGMLALTSLGISQKAMADEVLDGTSSAWKPRPLAVRPRSMRAERWR
jgi:hypothetical protein